MKRITPQEVVDAYAKTGLKPVQQHFVRDDGEVCALTAMARSTGKITADLSINPDFDTAVTELAAALDIDFDYAHCFINGFDGDDRHGESQVGYLDGRAAAAAVFGAKD